MCLPLYLCHETESHSNEADFSFSESCCVLLALQPNCLCLSELLCKFHLNLNAFRNYCLKLFAFKHRMSKDYMSLSLLFSIVTISAFVSQF